MLRLMIRVLKIHGEISLNKHEHHFSSHLKIELESLNPSLPLFFPLAFLLSRGGCWNIDMGTRVPVRVFACGRHTVPDLFGFIFRSRLLGAVVDGFD